MADVVMIDHEERRRREEEMERFLMEQEEQELLQQQRQREQDERGDGRVDEDDHLFVRRDDRNRMANNNVPLVDNNNNNALMAGENIPPVPPAPLLAPLPPSPKKPWLDGLFSYRPMTFFACFALLYYAFRTRRQYYLAMVYLSSSKWAYVVIGNAILALAVSIFDATIHLFVQGLRPHEAEGLQDFFRWNVTETCLALTIFRSELTIGVAVQFVLVILAKCLHHVAAQREEHLRLTEDAVHEYYPFLKSTHLRVMAFLLVLQFADLVTLEYMANTLLKEFPSVRILFAFEAAIMLVSAWSHILLWYMHLVDSLISFGHEREWPIASRLLHPWKEYKATLIFAVELQAQVVKFCFYMTFFFIVMSYYGMPINLFREVYLSFIALKERLAAFLKYRHLMASMNRFQPASLEELEENGRTCIICRDEMHVGDCKRLPGCGHIFHKSCLREWLVQQQSCPTCRSDIAAMEAQEAARSQAANAAAGRAAVVPPDPAAAAAAPTDADIQAAAAATDSTTSAHKSPAPTTALYRSLNLTTVWKINDPTSAAAAVVPAERLRMVSPGVLMLGQECAIAQLIEGQSYVVIRIPDGFVKANELQKVMDVPSTVTRT